MNPDKLIEVVEDLRKLHAVVPGRPIIKFIISGFKLPTLTVTTGAVVEFVNQDTTGHTATSADDKTFNSGTLTLNGGSFKFTASKAGTFPYACMIHPDMKGSITVQ